MRREPRRAGQPGGTLAAKTALALLSACLLVTILAPGAAVGRPPVAVLPTHAAAEAAVPIGPPAARPSSIVGRPKAT